MSRHGDELWILLSDFGERREVDGPWGFALAALAAAEPPWPRILAEPRISSWLGGVIPRDRIVPIPPGPPPGRLEAIDAGIASWIELFRIGQTAGDFSRIRSFGLRSALAGTLLARRCGIEQIPLLCPRRPPVPPDGVAGRCSRTLDLLEEWVVAESRVVRVPDSGSRARIEERHLCPPGRVRVARPAEAPERPCSRGERRPLAVLASTRRPGANRIALAAIRGIPEEIEIDWLSRRSGEHASRARQDLRRFGLAERVRWEEEPWRRFLLGGPVAWDLLLVPELPRSGRPLLAHVRASGGTIVAPAVDADRPDRRGRLSTAWTEERLAEILAVRFRPARSG